MAEFIERPVTEISIKRRKLVFGVGINDADYMTKQRIPGGKRLLCPYYRRWHTMLVRCYSEKFHQRSPTYKGCSVSEDWKNFMSFRKWMKSQDWQGMALDKDILIPNNKIYSAETCLFVPVSINNLINRPSNNKTGFPVGVGFHKHTGRIRAYCRVDGRHHQIGEFNDVESAWAAYRKFKYDVICMKADEYPKLKEVLLIHADRYLNGEIL